MRASWLLVVPLVVATAVPAHAAPVRVVTLGLTFAPETVEIARGDTLELINLEMPVHNVTSTVRSKKGVLLFSSPTVGAGQTAVVRGVQSLKPGGYSFLCSVHPEMRGLLVVR